MEASVAFLEIIDIIPMSIRNTKCIIWIIHWLFKIQFRISQILILAILL